MPSLTQPPTHPETIARHAGWRPDPQSRSIAAPIQQTSAHQFGGIDTRGGLERIDDFLADLGQALSAVGALARAA